jgi:hypothetical protein
VILQAAVACTRGWTRFYTGGLSADAQGARCQQIESDLWDSIDDARARGLSDRTAAAEIVMRLLLGMPDDLAWRGEESSPAMVSWRIRFAAMATLAAGMVALVVLTVNVPLELPEVSSPRMARFV